MVGGGGGGGRDGGGGVVARGGNFKAKGIQEKIEGNVRRGF